MLVVHTKKKINPVNLRDGVCVPPSKTHWHSFFVLSDVGASMVMAGVEGGPLTEPPLVPKILPLSANSNDVFR